MMESVIIPVRLVIMIVMGIVLNAPKIVKLVLINLIVLSVFKDGI